ncbi:hypothetical protein GJ496_001466 [Pomphorhynchus laevis]|nr:hypothetical protein GJ496_001466 [Pomphorhynchus laevis]
MPTLKDISRRLRSVVSIQKITKSMKMVSASKYARAERELNVSKAFGSGAMEFYEKTGLSKPNESINTTGKSLAIILSSDKGLCGSIHAGLARHIRALIRESVGEQISYVLLGDKIRNMLQRQLSKKFIFTGSGIGRKSVSFTESSAIALAINDIAHQFDSVSILYNHFKSIVAYKITNVPVFTADEMEKSQKLTNYDSADSEVIRCFQEFNLAAIIYYTFKENFTCELASRMNAMEGATKNAGELIDKLRLHYNRTRQFVITRELIEIISGASVLSEKEAR